MIIAIDFDETYNARPDMFDDMIEVLLMYKDTQVVLVTYRHREIDYDPLFSHLETVMGISVYCTDGKAKKQFMEDQGIKVDIWIDDNPRSVLEDSAWKHDSPELHAWREQQQLKLKAVA